MRTLKYVAFATIALAAASTLSACGGPGDIVEALSTAPDDAMHSSAAGMLGYNQDQLQFGENTRVGDRTSFDVTTPEGVVHRCTVKVAFGFVDRTDCTRKN